MSTLVADAKDLVYYDGRVQPSTPISLIPGAVPSKTGATLASELKDAGDANAVVLWGPNGSVSHDVDLGPGFFNQDPSAQGVTLLHELLHYALQMNDQTIDQTYGITGQIGDTYSSAFSAWLANDCTNPNNP
jgi:hypothetical protein